MGERLKIYKINGDYLKIMRGIDQRVSMKGNKRPFVGIVTMINNRPYAIPLTSVTNDSRIKKGKKKRSKRITTVITDSTGKEIAHILYNNMVPVVDGEYELLNVTDNTPYKEYIANEIRFIRKYEKEIIEKAKNVYKTRNSGKNELFMKLCCDFKKLEDAADEYVKKK